MAIEVEDLYLALPILGTAAALIFLYYISAILRHRRQSTCMAAAMPVRVPETIQSSQGQQRRSRRGNNRSRDNSGRRETNGSREGNGVREVSGPRDTGETRDITGSSRGRGDAYQEIITKANPKTGEVFTFFWGPNTVFSQWYPCSFTVDGLQYNCAEQYMMSQKASEFNVVLVSSFSLI